MDAAPPMKINAPMRLVVMKAKATGRPSAMKPITMKMSRKRAVYHSMGYIVSSASWRSYMES